MRALIGGSIVIVCAALAACSSSSDDSPATLASTDAGPDVVTAPPPPPAGGTDAGDAGIDIPSGDLAVLATLSPLPAVPADPTNAFADNAAAAVLGQRLFFDKSYSGPLAVADDGTNGGLGALNETGKVSCASCHGGPTMDDERSKPNNVSLGTDYGTRNALAVVNSSFYAWTNWGGRFDSQWSLPLAVAENAKIMNSTRLQIAHMLWNKYKTDYDAIFPVPLDAALDPAAADASRFPASGKPKTGAIDGAWEGMAPADQAIVNRIFANYGKAIAAYQRLVVSRNSAFDRFVAGDKAALTDSEKRGAIVFVEGNKGNCVSCHSGPNFADDKFHDIGVPQTGPHVPATDLGRYTDVAPLLTSPFNTSGAYSDATGTGKLAGLAQATSMIAQFRTKGLRGASKSAPYMHSGQLATLEAVVDFYATGGAAAQDGGTNELKALSLSDTDKADLVAFLKALDGDPVPASLLADTSK